MRFPFILKTVAFKPPLIYDCFMFAGFWKVWSRSLGGRLPICSLLSSLAGKGRRPPLQQRPSDRAGANEEGCGARSRLPPPNPPLCTQQDTSC